MAAVDSLRLELVHTVDVARPYPGETVTFFTRVAGLPSETGSMRLQVYLPACLDPILEAGRDQPAVGPSGLTRFGLQCRVVTWSLPVASESRPVGPDEYRIEARVRTDALEDTCLKSWAGVVGADGALLVQSEVVTVRVLAKARLLKYLPDIYHDEANALLWRYLMLFDRTLARYEELLSTLPYHFDPLLAPPNFQAWLAGWVGLAPAVHQFAPAGRISSRSALLPKMAHLYQKRGTRQGLVEFLAALLDLPAEYLTIEESLAGNFILGDETLLGDELLMGGLVEETCHFTVTVTWPGPPPPSGPGVETWLKAIIQAWKPAHTTFDLRLPGDQESGAGGS